MTKTDSEALWTTPFILTMAGMLFLFIPFSLYMPVLPAYLLKELGSSMEVAGAINGMFLAAAVLFRAQTSRLEARFGTRRVLLTSGFIFVATNLFYLATTSIPVIMLIRFLSGVCFALVNTAVMALATRRMPKSRVGEGIAYLTTMVLAGGAIGPYIGLSLAKNYGYDTVFIFTTVVTFLGMAIVSATPMESEQSALQGRYSFKELFEAKAIPISLIVLLPAIAYGGVLTFVAVFATELHLPVVTEYFFVVMAAASVFSRLATGRLFDRYGANLSICLALVLLTTGLLMLGSIHTTPFMLISAAFIGVGYGMVVPSIQALAIQFSPSNRSSAVTATFFTCLDGGVGLGAYLLGAGINVFGYATVYLSLGFMTLACLLPYYAIHARQQRECKEL